MDGAGSVQLPPFFVDQNVDFPRKPFLIDNLLIREVPRGLGIDFQGGPKRFILRGRYAIRVFEFLWGTLDGRKDLRLVLQSTPEDLPIQVVLETLELLHKHGVLQSGEKTQKSLSAVDPTGAPSTVGDLYTNFWNRKLEVTRSARSVEDVHERLKSAKVTVVAGGLVGYLAIELLHRSGITSVDVHALDQTLATWCDTQSSKPAFRAGETEFGTFVSQLSESVQSRDLLIAVVRNAPARLLKGLNAVCLDTRIPLLVANEDGVSAEVGPFVDPYRSACLVCKQLRRSLVSQRALEDYIFEKEASDDAWIPPTNPSGEFLSAAALIAAHIVGEVNRYFTEIAKLCLVNRIKTVDLLSGETTDSSVRRVPRCPECYPGTTFVGWSNAT